MSQASCIKTKWGDVTSYEAGSVQREKHNSPLYYLSMSEYWVLLLGLESNKPGNLFPAASLNGVDANFPFIFLLLWNIKHKQKIMQNQDNLSQSKYLHNKYPGQEG